MNSSNSSDRQQHFSERDQSRLDLIGPSMSRRTHWTSSTSRYACGLALAPRSCVAGLAAGNPRSPRACKPRDGRRMPTSIDAGEQQVIRSETGEPFLQIRPRPLGDADEAECAFRRTALCAIRARYSSHIAWLILVHMAVSACITRFVLPRAPLLAARSRQLSSHVHERQDDALAQTRNACRARDLLGHGDGVAGTRSACDRGARR